MDGWMDDRLKNRWLDGLMNRWMDGHILNRWMDGWMDVG